MFVKLCDVLCYVCTVHLPFGVDGWSLSLCLDVHVTYVE